VKTKAFGGSGKRVPLIGLGTWEMEQDDRGAAIRALRAGLDRGMTHVDTAELYGSGRVEEIVGEAIAGRRDEIFLVSKVLPSNASRRGTIKSCERSLKYLRTDHLDCYLLHWSGSHPLEDTIAAFEELVASGKIRSWGVSNFDEAELDEAVRIAGRGKIACNQVLYHLGERTIEHAVLPWCEREGMAVVGYTPFGRSTFPPRSAAGEVLASVARKLGATPRQLALAFLTRRPSLFAIPKSSDAEHVAENAGAGDIELGKDDVEVLERAFPVGRRRKGVAMI
jgi:diketogulonate reductase-like aldo/keto reductase